MASPGAKPKTKAKAKQSSVSKPGGASKWLRNPNEPRSEIRYEPSSHGAALAGVIISSGGAVLAGAGFFSQFLRGQGPHSYALYILLGGVVAFVAGLFISASAPRNIRIGDAGIAVEASKGIERIGWHEISSIALEPGVLAFRGPTGRVIHVPRSAHPAAFARALIDARARIPAKVEGIKEEAKAPPQQAGEKLPLPPPQLAGLHCRASDQLIAFEHDARLCGRCGETYHREGVPERCLSCDAELR